MQYRLKKSIWSTIASDTDGNLWVLGLRDIETKSADNTLKVFKEILRDLNDISDSENDPVSRDTIKHICATLSDRDCATPAKLTRECNPERKLHKVSNCCYSLSDKVW
jgi:hypothetical protein